jgi:hypothetical protein
MGGKVCLFGRTQADSRLRGRSEDVLIARSRGRVQADPGDVGRPGGNESGELAGEHGGLGKYDQAMRETAIVYKRRGQWLKVKVDVDMDKSADGELQQRSPRIADANRLCFGFQGPNVPR